MPHNSNQGSFAIDKQMSHVYLWLYLIQEWKLLNVYLEKVHYVICPGSGCLEFMVFFSAVLNMFKVRMVLAFQWRMRGVQTQCGGVQRSGCMGSRKQKEGRRTTGYIMYNISTETQQDTQIMSSNHGI